MRWLEHRIPPPIIAALAALVLWLVARTSFRFDWPTAAVHASGTLVAGLGLVVAVLGVRQFRAARTTLSPHRPDAASVLVTAGIYAWTRNPMYLGLALVLTGWAVGLAAPFALVGPVLFVLYITRFQIIPEERILAQKFGEDFATYRRRVRRWF